MAKDKDEVPNFSDEEWAEFERSFTAESAKSASYKEPSARQRELTARWKKEPPKDTGWRTDGAGTESRPSELYPPAASAGPRPKPVWKRNLAWVLVAILVTGAAVGLPSLFGGSPRKSSGGDRGTRTNGQTSYVTPLPSQSGDALSALASPTPGADGPADPFAGSPAEQWATGADGIVPPAAVALGRYSRADVAKLESQAKLFLVAANLDPAVLAGGTPQAALDMIDPETLSGRDTAGRQLLKDALVGDLAHPTAAHDPTGLFTRFRAAETALDSPTAVRVHGSMAPSLDKDGQLQVKVDYLFVYAVRPAGHPEVPARRVIVRRQMTLKSYTLGKLAPAEWDSYHVGMPCGVDDGFYHPVFDVPDAAASTSTVSPEPVKGTVDPYDQSVQPTGTCNAVTRT